MFEVYKLFFVYSLMFIHLKSNHKLLTKLDYSNSFFFNLDIKLYEIKYRKERRLNLKPSKTQIKIIALFFFLLCVQLKQARNRKDLNNVSIEIFLFYLRK